MSLGLPILILKPIHIINAHSLATGDATRFRYNKLS